MCNKCDCKTDAPVALIPFDLEAAKAGAPIQTRDGRKAILIGFVPSFANPVISTIEGTEYLNRHDKTGRYFNDSFKSHFDLFMAPKASRTNTIYLARSPYGGLHFTLRDPSKSNNWELLGSKELTITEGEFHDSENS